MPDHGPNLFAGAAPHYVAHRPPYSPALFDVLVERVPLDGSSTVLDLGCGPGTLTVPLADRCGRVIAVDPGPQMLDTARARVEQAGCDNVELVAALAEDLPGWITGLRATVMGRSFHWMDRELVLRELDARTEPGGAVALVRTDSTGRDVLRPVIAPIVERYLGPDPRDRASAEWRRNHHHLDVLAASPFAAIEEIDLPPVEHRWTVDSAAGYLYSVSYTSPHHFGDRLEEFDAELRAALAAFLPQDGLSAEVVTHLVLARRPRP